MREPRAPLLLFLPSVLALLVSGYLVIVGSGGESFLSAQIIGGPTDSAVGFRGRLRVFREYAGGLSALGGEVIVLRARQGELTSSLELVTGTDGWAEFRMSRRVDEELQLEVINKRGATLLSGSPSLTTDEWARSVRRRGLRNPRAEKGDLRAEILVESGVLSVPFDSQVRLNVSFRGEPLAGAKVEVSAIGATLLSGERGETNEAGIYRLSLRPEQHTVTLDLVIRARAEVLRIHRPLPVVPGSLSLKREGRKWWIRSPISRESAWFSVVTERDRLQGGQVQLSTGADGIARGSIDSRELSVPLGAYLVLSTSAEARSLGTVGIPLKGQSTTFDAADLPLLDGSTVARALAHSERKRARWILAAYVALSGLLTLGLLIWHVRRAEKILDQGLKRAEAREGTRSRSSLPLVIAALSLFFAFSLGVLWIVAR